MPCLSLGNEAALLITAGEAGGGINLATSGFLVDFEATVGGVERLDVQLLIKQNEIHPRLIEIGLVNIWDNGLLGLADLANYSETTRKLVTPNYS